MTPGHELWNRFVRQKLLSNRVPAEAKQWALAWNSHVNTNALVFAMDRHHIVGFWAGIVHDRTMTSRGTWVDPVYRRQGVALGMWEFGISAMDIRSIRAESVTHRGAAYLASLHTKGIDVEVLNGTASKNSSP